MIKFIVTLLILLTLIIILKKEIFFLIKAFRILMVILMNLRLNTPIECKLFNEIIDRKQGFRKTMLL